MSIPEEKKKDKKVAKSILNLLEVANVPDAIKTLLSEAKNDGKVNDYTLGVEVVKILENELTDQMEFYLHPARTDDDLKTSIDSFTVCFSCLKQLTEFPELSAYLQLKLKHLLVAVVKLPSFDMKIRNQMCQIAEKIIEANKFKDDDDRGASLLVYLFLLDLNLDAKKSTTRTDIKRLWSMHHILGMYDILDSQCKPILDRLIKSVSSHNFLNYKEGRQHVANFLSLQQSLVQPIQKEIMAILGENKSLGHFYGEIYFGAWTNAKKPVRDEIETECIQTLMSTFFKLARNGLEMDPMTKVVFKILSHLHHSRRIINFSEAITRLYTPLIWRSLKSHHPYERCNAAEIFFDVFPLEKPQVTIVDYSAYKDKQFQAVMDLLKDDCHFCRIIAIKGVCRILSHVSECLSNNQCKELLFYLTNESANDSSSPLVRQAVFQGFTYMLSHPDSATLLQTILPQMTNHFHDVNEKVRKAFTEILLKVQQSEFCTLKYTDIVPMEHIIARLSLENKVVGELIVKLIMKKFFTTTIELREMISRLNKLIIMCPKAAEKLFQFSQTSLSVGEMHLLILSILSFLRKCVQKKIDPKSSDKEDKENTGDNNDNEKPLHQAKKKKKKKQSAVLQESVESVPSNDSNNQMEEDQVYDIDDETVKFHTHLLLCIQVGWLAFHDKLNLPENSEMLNNLYTLTVGSLQLFLRYYRGTPAYYATIAFSSLIPIGKLVPTTTVTSSCMSELKITDKQTPDKVIETLVYGLCAWNRGNEVIELCMDWIDPAFKYFQLNSSSIVKPGKKKATVRFQKYPGKHSHAVRILKLLFSDYINEKRLTDKCYESVLELYNYMERIKVVIDRRVGHDPDFPRGVFDDEFILECFEIVLGLTHVLHRPDQPPQSSSSASVDLLEPFNAPQVHIQYMDWAAGTLLTRLPPKEDPSDLEDPMVLDCLLILLKSCDLNVRIKLTDEFHCKALALFVKRLLTSEWGIWFLEVSLSLITHLCEHTEAWVPKDDWAVFSRICPFMFSDCLLTFEKEVLSEKTFIDFKLDIKSIRKNVVVLPAMLVKIYGPNDSNFIQVIQYIVEGCVQGTFHHLNSIKEVELYTKFDGFPYFIGFIVKHLVSNNRLAKPLIQALKKYISENNKDGLLMLSCLTFFHTLVCVYKKKFLQVDLEVAVHECYSHIINYTPPPPSDDSFQDDFPVDIYSTGMDILKKIGEAVGCSIHPPT